MTLRLNRPAGESRRPGRDEVVFIAVLGLLTAAVYLRTLYPGLVATGDSPKFQYLGRVLGTAHNPGYPLYIMLSHVFAWIPLGTLAYRMNLFSACWAVATVVLVALTCRRLGCGRFATAVASWGLAFGQVFWSQALLAEVYAMACGLLAGSLYMLIVWARTGRQAWLLGAVALLALSAGHHLTVVTVAPALAVFVLLEDRRVLARRSFVLGTLGLLALGLAQYAFIVVRTRQGVPYLGSRATNLAELWDVLRARQFGFRLFAFDLRELLTVRPALVGRLLWNEVGAGGALLATLGASALVRERRPLAVLLLGGALGPIVFALDYDVPDLQVFVILSYVLIWLLVALGAEAVTRNAAGWGGWRVRAAGAALACLPIWQLGSNFKVNDHRDRTFEARYFSALLERLPARSAVVTEDHSVDQMLNYMLYGEGWAARKTVELIPPSARHVDAQLGSGMHVFAFDQGAALLEREHMVFAPVRLLDCGLADMLNRLPPGFVVLAAANRDHIPRFVEHLRRAQSAMPKTPRAPALFGGFAMLAVVGEKPPDAWTQDGALARVAAGPRQEAGDAQPRLPVSVRAVAGYEGVLVEAGGTVLEACEAGAIVVVLRPNGKPFLTEVFEKPGEYKVGFPPRALPVRELVHRSECRGLANRGWVEITDLGRLGWLDVTLDNHRPAEARFALLIAGELTLSPRVFRLEAPRAAAVEEEAFELSIRGERDRMARRLRTLGLAAAPPIASRSVALLRLAVNDLGESSRFRVAPGGVAVRLWAQAQVDRDEAWRATVCDLPMGGTPLVHDPAGGAVALAGGEALAPYLDGRWGAAQPEGALQYRRCADPPCEILLPLAEPQALGVRLTLRGAAGDLRLRVNGQVIGGTTLCATWCAEEWHLPLALTRRGVNRLQLSREPSAASGARPFDLAFMRLAPVERPSLSATPNSGEGGGFR